MKYYQEKKNTLLNLRKKLNQKITELQYAEKELRDGKKNLFLSQKTNLQLIAQIKKSQELSMYYMQELKKRGKDTVQNTISDMASNTQSVNLSIKKLLQPSLLTKKGHLSYPVANTKIIESFRVLKDTKHPLYWFHKGVFLRAPHLSPVTSIFNGKVVFANPLRGYGKTIIIEHSDHYHSIYAHNHHFKVAVGDLIQEGQEIASSGQSSTLFGEGIYFELRYFSSSIDPLPWLRNHPTTGNLNQKQQASSLPSNTSPPPNNPNKPNNPINSNNSKDPNPSNGPTSLNSPRNPINSKDSKDSTASNASNASKDSKDKNNSTHLSQPTTTKETKNDLFSTNT